MLNIDLDEIKPNRFIIYNAQVRVILRGEGVIVGKFFDLVTWRREGLIARIRMRGFNVRTIQDRIDLLPAIAEVAPPGAQALRLLAAKERIGIFERADLHWRDLQPILHENRPAVRLHEHVAIRRRKSRGKADFYITTLNRASQINFLPVTETDALLHAYGQIAGDDRPAIARFSEQADAYVVPQDQLILPPPHAAVLDMLALDHAARWTFPKAVADQVEDVFAKLAIEIQPQTQAANH